MDETYKIRAVVLDRQAFRESDLAVTLYSQERGKINFVARGAKKGGSKLSGYLEPIGLIDVMAIKGKSFDYLGSAESENCFASIKEDFDKTSLAGQAISFFKKSVKENEPDEELFNQLVEFLKTINDLEKNEINKDKWLSFFFLKIVSQLGHEPELYLCTKCQAKILPGKNGFDYSRGGVLCEKCNNSRSLTISDDCIKVLRTIILSDFLQLKRLVVNKNQEAELVKTVNSFVDYNMS